MGNGTASQLTVPGAYVEFQLAVLRALPRDINPDVADGWRNNGQSLARALREALLPPDEPAAELVPTPKPEPQPILRFLDTITLSARTEKFVPKKSYVINTKRGSHVKIGYVDSDFTAWFGEKAEEPTAETKLRRIRPRPSVGVRSGDEGSCRRWIRNRNHSRRSFSPCSRSSPMARKAIRDRF